MANYQVGIGVRIVPAGVQKVGDKNMLRATLLLSPIAAKKLSDPGETKIDITQWPQLIEKELTRIKETEAVAGDAPSNISILFAPVKAGAEIPTPAVPGGPMPAFRAMYHLVPQDKKPVSFAAWAAQRSADCDKIGKMWEKLLAPCGVADWDQLIAALENNGAAESLGKLRPTNTDGSKAAPDIRNVGRGQAALLLSLERGRSLLARIKLEAEGKCSTRDDECDLASPLAKPGESESERLRAANRAAMPKDKRDELDAIERDADAVEREVARAERTRLAREIQQRAKAEHDKLEKPAAAMTRRARADLYTGLLECNSRNVVAECLQLAVDEAKKLAEAIDQGADRHSDAMRENDAVADKGPRDLGKDHQLSQAAKSASMRLLALQNQPSLARLFNLAVDVLIPFDTFASDNQAGAAQAYIERRGVAGTSRFGFLSARIKSCTTKLQTWTVCKVRLPNDKLPVDVWPCTRVELDLFAALSDTDADRKKRDTLISEGALPQVDGVVHLAAARSMVSGHEPRFDIISLDAAQAVESRETAKIGVKPGAPPVVTRRTAGLAMIDRWRETSALVQALRSLSRDANPGLQELDAEDLTMGYRMDVGAGQSQLKWWSLCNRSIFFGDADCPVEEILARVVPSAADRLAFDSAMVVMPAKIKEAADATDGGAADKTLVAHVEDTVGHWTGPPMGVDPESGDVALSKNPLALQLSQRYSLMPHGAKNDGAYWKIVKLLFGGGYHLGLTACYRGGVVRSFDATGARYQLDCSESECPRPERDFGMLPTRYAGPRRFLRHERIEAPVVTTPKPTLERKFDKIADGLRETSSEIVIRSQRKGKSDEFEMLGIEPGGPGIGSSYRVVVPPSVAAVFADRHNAFKHVTAAKDLTSFQDRSGKNWMGPIDGLQDMDYDDRAGGFPVFGHSASSDGRIEVAADPAAKPTGHAVFRPRAAKPEPRRDPYYPDPAASFMVVAVRDLAGRLLPGKPLIVPIRPLGSPRFPSVRPVAIDVVAAPSPSKAAVTQERILGLQPEKGDMLRADGVFDPKFHKQKPATVYLDGSAVLEVSARGPTAASRVVVKLEPGESFEIDIWCLPEEEDLRKLFDVVESAALVASVDGGKSCETCEQFSGRLKSYGLNNLADFVRRLGLSRDITESVICTCTAGVAIPKGALYCLADAVHKLMRSRPVPELAARVTMTATHAIALPFRPPVAALKLERGLDLVDPAASPEIKAKFAQPNKEAVSVVGTVTVDRPTTGFFEVVGKAVSLVSNAFDDHERRKRTPDEVARGLWPRSPVTGERMRIEQVYGFKVDKNGMVTLPYEQATLLRVDDDIAAPDANAERMTVRDLAVLQTAAQSGGQPPASEAGNVVRINAPFTISDSRARFVTTWVSPGSRTGGYFRDEKGDVADLKDLAVAKDLPLSNAMDIAVLSTKAPAKVAPLTILPAFSLHQPEPGESQRVFTVRRRVKLRIRMRRPWFSSGEGERLGIVLWPPEILKGRVNASDHTVARDYEVSGSETAAIAMKGFEDDDLGPGGAFVTRWGLDPTKGGGEIGWIMEPSALADLARSTPAPADVQKPLPPGPVYVPRASVPIPVDAGAKQAKSVRLEAALLTYVPRFDIDHECWFCDIELDPGTAPDPFLRLGLVRYQHHAERDLRVSEPVVEWVQIPPQRSVEVNVRQKQLHVTVEGFGRVSAAVPALGVEAPSIGSWTQRSVMKVSVLRTRSDGVTDVASLDPNTCGPGSVYDARADYTWIPRTQAEWTSAFQLDAAGNPRPRPALRADNPGGNTRTRWKATFDLAEDPLKPAAAGTSYAVLVEEVEAMLPASYVDEPLEPGVAPSPERQDLVVSGPRFAALVDLKPATAPHAMPPPASAGSPNRGKPGKKPPPRSAKPGKSMPGRAMPEETFR